MTRVVVMSMIEITNWNMTRTVRSPLLFFTRSVSPLRAVIEGGIPAGQDPRDQCKSGKVKIDPEVRIIDA